MEGSPAAFERLYLKYAGKMKGVALRYMGDHSLAEDVVQESFVKVFKKISQFKPTGSFEGWLRRVVVNTAVDHYHSGKQYADVLAGMQYEEDNDEELDSAYTIDELLGAVNALPPGYKMVFNMYVMDGYTHKEIAGLLKISEGTSKSQFSKAKAFLREYLTKKPVVRHG